MFQILEHYKNGYIIVGCFVFSSGASERTRRTPTLVIASHGS